MKIDKQLIYDFENGLDPKNISASKIKAKVLGYGEISSIFELEENPGIAFKRMPLFSDKSEASDYASNFKTYCRFLKKAGLSLPEDETIVVAAPNHPVVLYIAQKKLKSKDFVHQLIHHLKGESLSSLMENVVKKTVKIWEFNAQNKQEIELALDGQLSNWVFAEGTLFYIDTSTPMFRLNSKEQLNPDLLLQSAPGFLRWLLKLFFMDDVMNRYYDLRLVFIDMIANLYKEQKQDLIPDFLEIANRYLPTESKAITRKEIESYYKEDKLIWTLFLSFRRVDRWISTRVLGKRYEFILPGRIKR